MQIAGQMQIGARYNFERAEVYWPEESEDLSKIRDLVKGPETIDQGLVPQFDASVQASADLDILVTPEANMGIRVGGGAGIFGSALVDAQIVGFVNNTLRFHAEAQASTGTSSGSSTSYSYGAYLLYNLGYGGYATIPFYSWNAQPRNLFSTPKQVTLYENRKVAPGSATKRDLEDTPQLPRRGLLNSIGNIGLASTRQQNVRHSAAKDLEPICHLAGNHSALERRQQIPSGNDPAIGQISTFSLANLFTCPQGDNCQPNANPGISIASRRADQPSRRAPSTACASTLPDFRCKSYISSIRESSCHGVSQLNPFARHYEEGIPCMRSLALRIPSFFLICIPNR